MIKIKHEHLKKNLLLSTILFIAALFTVLPMMENMLIAANGSNISPDSSFFYNGRDLYEITQGYGDDGIRAYIKSRWTYDLLWPAIYFYFMFTLVAGFRYVIKSIKVREYILILPIIAVTLDIVENILCSIYMANFTSPIASIATLASLVSSAKWLFVFTTFACMIYLPIKGLFLRTSKA